MIRVELSYEVVYGECSPIPLGTRILLVVKECSFPYRKRKIPVINDSLGFIHSILENKMLDQQITTKLFENGLVCLKNGGVELMRDIVRYEINNIEYSDREGKKVDELIEDVVNLNSVEVNIPKEIFKRL